MLGEVAGQNGAKIEGWLRVARRLTTQHQIITKMPKRSTRRNHSSRFKFRVALEAAKGLRSINEIAAEHKLAPSQVTAWKKELLAEGSALFERKNAKNHDLEAEKERTDALERTLGRVVVEKEFLVKKCEELGIEP